MYHKICIYLHAFLSDSNNIKLKNWKLHFAISNFCFNDVIKYFLYHSFATIHKAVIGILDFTYSLQYHRLA